MSRGSRHMMQCLVGSALAGLLAAGCGPGVDGQLVVTSSVLGDATLVPDACSGAGWDGYTSVLLYDEAEPHWEIELSSQGDFDRVTLVVFGRQMAMGACEHLSMDVHTDWEDGEISGRVTMDCSLLAGGHVEGEVRFWSCR